MNPNKGVRKYLMKGNKDKDVYFQVIHSTPEARAYLVANQVELAELSIYPLPNKITADRGKEFYAEFKIMIANDYRIP